jgi:signal transduction histidine kinase
METASTTDVLLDDTSGREWARQRLYVICQAGGWGLYLTLQLAAIYFFSEGSDKKSPLTVTCVQVTVVATGLLLSHYFRLLITRWRWKQLGWRALIPRVISAAIVLSILWSTVGYGYFNGLLRVPQSPKYPLGALFTVSIIYGSFMFIGWMCLYFFYHLFDRFNRSEIERLRLMATVKDAELRALKSQVNPHFIFNSLNSLRALIDEEPARARQAVTQLANLLRYSLQSGQLETVPFEEELRVVNDYLALEQVRHEERLRLRLDIGPDTLQLPVPPMLLQTLVENAVKYGISVRPEGGEIAIIARREANALRLQVTNPGEIAAPATRPPNASTGLGFANAADRLRLLFGERATLQLRAESPERVMAEAVIPLILTNA